MNKIVFVLGSLIASNLFASPAATQSWVREYVRTNSTQGAYNSGVASATMNIDGTNVTLSLVVKTSSEPAWIIEESSVTGMPVGVKFATDSFGNACNYTNSACNVIYQSASTNWLKVSCGVTSTVSVTKLEFAVNGVQFSGFENPQFKYVDAAGTSVQTGTIRFRRTYVTPREKKELTTPPTSVSLLGLLFGTANAAWVAQEWKVRTDIEPNPYEDAEGKNYITQWERHYEWDGNGGTVEIDSLVAKFVGGATKEYLVNFSKAYVQSGSDLCKDPFVRQLLSGAKTTERLVADVKDEVSKAIEQSLKDDAKMLVVFNRFMNAGYFDGAIGDAVADALADILTASECPEYTTTTDPIPEEEKFTPTEPPKEEYIPPSFPECTHPNWRCSSDFDQCKFSCITCGKVEEFSEHHYADSSDHCAVCDNEYPEGSGNKCGVASCDPEDHDFSNHEGVAQGCYCKHRGLWDHRGPWSYADNVYYYDDEMHWRKEKCETCYHIGPTDIDKHSIQQTPCTYIDDSKHEITNYCSVCNWKERVLSEPHSKSQTDVICEWKDESVHLAYPLCSKCGKYVLKGEESHYAKGITIPPKCEWWEKNDDGESHRGMCWCGGNGCTGTYVCVKSERCYNTYQSIAEKTILVENKALPDTNVCAVTGCGRLMPTNHHFAANDYYHWCDNKTGVTRHLSEEHDFSGGDTCPICRYDRIIHRESTNVVEEVTNYVKVVSATCNVEAEAFQCYIIKYYVNSVYKGISETHCAYGWDMEHDRCGCDMCKWGIDGLCKCPMHGIIGGPSAGPISGSNGPMSEGNPTN